MDDRSAIIDESIKEEILRYPMVDLIRTLFPGHPVRRGVMRSPFRQDSNPSFSCFRGKNGISLGKDHSTGVTYDNIMVYMAAFPGYGYVEAVDMLSKLVLGKTALVGRDEQSFPVRRRNMVARPVIIEKEQESVLKPILELSLGDSSVPVQLRTYWRSRGISDLTASQMCSYYVIENTKRKGQMLIDRQSGLPILDKGNTVYDDGQIQAIGHKNDIGGVVFRSPDTSVQKGFKGATSSFISTFLADNSRPISSVSFFGNGDSYVHFLRYEPKENAIYINPTQGFSGIGYSEINRAMAFMAGFSGYLDSRERKCACAVLSSLNVPVSPDVVVVEGMFDGLSEREMNKGIAGRKKDMVILNSVSNIRWAVPFLSRHARIISMMDNDIRSGAGQKAFKELAQEIEAFNARLGCKSLMFDGSVTLGNHKDLNDALIAAKGFPQETKKKSNQ